MKTLALTLSIVSLAACHHHDTPADQSVAVDAATADDCGVPNGGLGNACTYDPDNCQCGNSCAGTTCVTPPKCSQALLNWTSSAFNTDGSCVDLGGFKLYWGPNPGPPYPNMLDLHLPCTDDGTTVACGDMGMSEQEKACTYTLSNLANGTLYFAISSYNTMGVEGPPSGAVSLDVDCPPQG